ncbi:MAG: DNA repair protein RecN [Nitrospiraceae bacterium]
MLTELRISNFAVIDRLVLNFSTGFHVLTGETGAGKSILVDAIALLVGGRGSADQIRAEAEEAELEASFALQADGPLAERLRALDLLKAGESDLMVRRILSRTGRHRAYVNGISAPLHILQSLAGTLVDIHGQHDQQSLLSPPAQMDALDAFGRLSGLRQDYTEQYTRWLARRRELESAERIIEDRAAREDMLQFQYRELVEADLSPGEEERLSAERHRLSHARRLAELEHDAYDALYAGDSSVLAGLSVVADRLRELEKIDAETGEWISLSDVATVQLGELAQRLRAYREGLDEDPERLSRVEERLDRLQRLRKKYGGTIDSLLAHAGELKRQLDESCDAEAKMAGLRAVVDQDVRRVRELAQCLSGRRLAAGRQLETRVEGELAALRMDQTRFRITIRPDEDGSPGPTGCDRVECVLSANQGEPLQPLARVASGGELSRVMLAIKTVLAETDGVPVLIFDEVDAGIGGAVAAVMGQRLRALSNFHQIFCITHLPQIASQAATHFRVHKSVIKKRTVTRVTPLDSDGRREEIARMLGGVAITKTVRDTAAEMIEDANSSPKPTPSRSRRS